MNAFDLLLKTNHSGFIDLNHFFQILWGRPGERCSNVAPLFFAHLRKKRLHRSYIDATLLVFFLHTSAAVAM